MRDREGSETSSVPKGNITFNKGHLFFTRDEDIVRVLIEV